jgi:hypothetical protein
MANNLTFNPTQLPAFARNRNKESSLSKALAGGGGGGGGGFPHRISIKGGVFRLIADGKEIAALDERYMDVVIVNADPKMQRQFYPAKFDENVASAPACWSSDGNKPDADVREAPASSCADCPNNIKGSGNGDSKACRFQKRLALVLANDVTGNVMQLVVPGKSLFGKEDGGNFPLQAYAHWLKAQNIEPNEVVTRIRFDTKEASPKLFFKTASWLTDEEFAIVEAKGKTEAAQSAVLLNAKAPSAPAPVVVPKLAAPVEDTEEDEEEAPKPKAKAKAKPRVEEPEDTEEPVVRKTAEAPSIPASKGMASIVAAWDTDD